MRTGNDSWTCPINLKNEERTHTHSMYKNTSVFTRDVLVLMAVTMYDNTFLFTRDVLVLMALTMYDNISLFTRDVLVLMAVTITITGQCPVATLLLMAYQEKSELTSWMRASQPWPSCNFSALHALGAKLNTFLPDLTLPFLAPLTPVSASQLSWTHAEAGVEMSGDFSQSVSLGNCLFRLATR